MTYPFLYLEISDTERVYGIIKDMISEECEEERNTCGSEFSMIRESQDWSD